MADENEEGKYKMKIKRERPSNRRSRKYEYAHPRDGGMQKIYGHRIQRRKKKLVTEGKSGKMHGDGR